MVLFFSNQRGGKTSLVVGYSGGFSSAALLTMFEEMMKKDSRTQSFTVSVVWIDCFDILPVEQDVAAHLRQEIEKVGSSFPEFVRLPLCCAFSPDSFEERDSCKDLLKQAFTSNPKNKGVVAGGFTWKEELLDCLIRSILVRYAQSKGCHRIVSGESMSRCCVKLFSNMSRGVGINATLVTAGVDPLTFGHRYVL